MAFRFKSVRTRLYVWFFLVALIPLIVVVSIIYLQRLASIKEEAFQKLIAIRDLKVTHVEIWLQEKIGDIRLLAEVPAVRSLKSIMLPKGISVFDLTRMNEVRENFKARIKNYKDYTEISLISAYTGKVALASHEDLEGEDRSKNSFFTEPLKTKSFFINDIHY